MSTSSTIRANAPGQSVLERLASFRLPSPAIVSALLMGCVFLLRLPSTLVPHEWSVDESQLVSQAMKFLVDPRPWIAVDPHTVGPLNSYLISILLLLGFRPGFILVHMLATVLVCLQVLTAHRTLLRLGSEKMAAFGAFLMVLIYGLANHTDYLGQTSEWLTCLLVMIGFHAFLVWLHEPAGHRPVAQLAQLFLSGLALGTAPWCKLQAGPISGALGLVVLAAIFRDRGYSFSFSKRGMEVLSFCFGAILTSGIMLAVLVECGALKDFWYSYILGNLSYAGPLSLTRGLMNFLLVFLISPIHQLLLVALLGLSLLFYASRSNEVLALFRKQHWAFGGLLVYAVAALFAVCRSSRFFPHYVIFLVPPMTYIAALLASCGAAWFAKPERPPQKLRAALLLVVLFATMALYLAYGVRYIEMVEAVRQLSHSQPDLNARIPKDVPDTEEADSNDRTAKVKGILARIVGPGKWATGDSNERIAAVVRDIQETRPVRSLTIWGYAPGVYVLTGMPPATRDATGAFVISKWPRQKYYQDRFLGDLREKNPDLFVDAVTPDAFMWLWTEDDRYESDPELRKFIEDNYILIDQLTLVKGARPVRFFARRGIVLPPQ